MTIRRLSATLLALLLCLTPVVAQQSLTVGAIAGNAKDEAKKPYSDYEVRLRDVGTGQLVLTQPLDAQGLFNFANVPLSKRYLVELFSVKKDSIVCTQGPYTLAAPDLVNKTNVNIDCGGTPTALWLLLAGAGTAAAVVAGTASASR